VPASFADRLILVLKALSISRGRLAADVGVDKSLVGRWCSGAVAPASPNRARLTQVIAGYSPGFTLHDWDAPLETLAKRFGVTLASAAGPPELAGAALPWALLAEAAPPDTVRGADYEGFWRSTRPSSEMPGQFVHDHIMLRRDATGGLGFTLGIFDVRFHGWALSQQHQLFAVAADKLTGTFVFAILNGVVRQRAEVVDGLVLTCLRDTMGTPIACKVLLERVGDLTGDDAADDARFAELAQAFPFSTADQVPEQVRNHIWTDTGPGPFAAGGDQMLLMRFATTMARGPVFEDPRS
jgi:hypothetical protein